MDTDEVLKLIGIPYNRFTVLNFIIYAFTFGVASSWIVFAITFQGDRIPFHCKIEQNMSEEEHLPMELNSNTGKHEHVKCSKYVYVNGTQVKKGCDNKYTYLLEENGYESTIISDFNLVCQRKLDFELSMMISAMGGSISCILLQQLCDRFGRRWIFFIFLCANLITSFSLAFVEKFLIYLFLMCLNGFAQGVLMGVSCILSLELFRTEQRSCAGATLNLFWACGYMSLALVAYLIRDWRKLQIAVSIPLVVSFALFYFTNESVIWLIANNRLDEAERILQRGARWNGFTIPNGTLVSLLKSERSSQLLHDIESLRESLRDHDTESLKRKAPAYRGSIEFKNRQSLLSHTAPPKISKSFDPLFDVTDSVENLQVLREELSKEGRSLNESEKNTSSTSWSLSSATNNRVEGDNIDKIENRKENETLDPKKKRHVSISLKPDIRMEDAIFKKLISATKPNTMVVLQDILQSQKLRKYTIILALLWLMTGFIYYGLSFTVTFLPGDRYINTLLFAAGEIPAYSLTWWINYRKGRRYCFLVSYFFCSVSLVMSNICSHINIKQVMVVFKIFFVVLGKMWLSAAFATLMFYSPELYPTNVRTTAFGICYGFGRFGLFLAPLARILAPWSILYLYLLCGFLTLICFGLCYFLPETRYSRLPDTIEEAESAGRSSSSDSTLQNPDMGCQKHFVLCCTHFWKRDQRIRRERRPSVFRKKIAKSDSSSTEAYDPPKGHL